MRVTLEVPEPVAKTLGYARETLQRRALETLLADECARGRLSRGRVAELLEVRCPPKTRNGAKADEEEFPRCGGAILQTPRPAGSANDLAMHCTAWAGLGDD